MLDTRELFSGGIMNVRGAIFIAGISFGLLSLISCSKLGKGPDGEADDGDTPYMISDLRVAGVSDSTVTLKWTATGDDANVGTASQYDLRISRETITNSNWDSATQVSGEPAPSPAGQTDSMVVTGLMTDTTYYFALAACDEAGNCSGRSNCVAATCITDYIVVFPDSDLEAAIRRMIFKPSGDIHKIDLMALVFLEANGAGVMDLTGLEHCTNLVVIYMGGNSVSDLTPISGLWRLRDIQFTGNNISVISPVASLMNLEVLVFRSNPLADISILSDLTNLHKLDLAQSGLSDIGPLVSNSGLAAGDTVYLENNPLSQEALDIQIPTLESRGVFVNH
jgi:hypothetical protein